ncbi:MAG TPA: adenylate/guanylate cyclase domain-containing protein, partial [Gaiellaceae bacterium]|nr:adenylate/guanylate cyclase domain-containing protein [Gaiellaceae bacterium]
LDVLWENHPGHFWLVLAAAAVNAVLAYATGEAARRRGDSRLFLISLAFLASAGFLGMHALATPGVLLDGKNAGFVIATPIGLVAAGALAALSARVGGTDLRRLQPLRSLIVACLIVWAAWSLTSLPPLNREVTAEVGSPPLIVLGSVGVLLYGYAAARYVEVWRARRCLLPAAVVTAFALLAEAMLAIAFSRNWHATWWEWHLLMLVAFGLVGYASRRQWHEERFSDLYLDETRGSIREVSVLFADLQGFTAFSEQVGPGEVQRMLNEYFETAVPLVAGEHGGEVDKLIGDAIMVTFNTRGDQPDHPERAASAGLALQRETGRIRDRHPDWPRFRVGINTGEASVGLLGAAGGRGFTVVGDTVNLASRLEGQARAGEVVIGTATRERLPPAIEVERIADLEVKGKERPVAAFVLRALPSQRSSGQRNERLAEQDEKREG